MLPLLWAKIQTLHFSNIFSNYIQSTIHPIFPVFRQQKFPGHFSPATDKLPLLKVPTGSLKVGAKRALKPSTHEIFITHNKCG